MLHDVVLNGCAPEPLIHYLKALGMFRLIAEQCDPQVRGAWRGDAFMLEIAKTPDELMTFLMNEYSPTPIVAPWNGSSGLLSQRQESAGDARSPSAADPPGWGLRVRGRPSPGRPVRCLRPRAM